MSPPTLIVSVSEVARRADLDVQDERTRYVIETAIRSAQTAVQAYLHQPVVPTRFVDRGRAPVPGRWHLLHHPVLEVLSAVPETDFQGEATGLFTVTYMAGMNAADPEDQELEPIRQYVTQQAVLDPEVTRLRQKKDPMFDRRISSVSVEGQSVSYEKASGGSSAGDGKGPVEGGVALTLKSLDYWRIRAVSTGRRQREEWIV